MATEGSVLVAMSGGVDSSVAACLLHEQGYEVLGSHMRLAHLDGLEHGCCGPSARRDAEAVARLIGFPFEVADMTLEFDEHVLDDFVAEHAAGRTPNPCPRWAQLADAQPLNRGGALGDGRVGLLADGGHVAGDAQLPALAGNQEGEFAPSRDQAQPVRQRPALIGSRRAWKIR